MSHKNILDSRAQSEHYSHKLANLHLSLPPSGSHVIKRIHQVSVRFVRKQGHLGGLVE